MTWIVRTHDNEFVSADGHLEQTLNDLRRNGLDGFEVTYGTEPPQIPGWRSEDERAEVAVPDTLPADWTWE